MPELSYTAWIANYPRHQTLPRPPIRSDREFPTRLAYALNLNPTLPNLLPGGVVTNNHLTLTYTRRNR